MNPPPRPRITAIRISDIVFAETLSKQAAAQLQRAHVLLRHSQSSPAPLSHAQQALSGELLLLLPRSQGGLQSPTATENGSSEERGGELSPDSIAAASPPRPQPSRRSGGSSLHASTKPRPPRAPVSIPAFIIPKVVESSSSDSSPHLSSSALRSALSIMASASEKQKYSRQHSSPRASTSSPRRQTPVNGRGSSSDAALQRTGEGLMFSKQEERRRRREGGGGGGGSSKGSSSSRSSTDRGKRAEKLQHRAPSPALVSEDAVVSQNVGSDRAAGDISFSSMRCAAVTCCCSAGGTAARRASSAQFDRRKHIVIKRKRQCHR